jgi:hypothetical protein
MSIAFVNGSASAVINGANVSFDVSSWGLLQNDVLVVIGGIGGTTAGTQGASGNTSGGFQSLYSNDSGANQFFAGWQRMGATPDTTITCTGNADTGDSTAYGIVALRGVSRSTPPTAATTTTATASSTDPNPASITHTTAGCAVVVGALSTSNDAAITAPSTYATPGTFSGGANDGEDASIGIAYKLAPAATEDPGTFGSWTTGLWQAATIALGPHIEAAYGAQGIAGNPVGGLIRDHESLTSAAPPSHPMGCGLVSPTREFSALHCIFESQITG